MADLDLEYELLSTLVMSDPKDDFAAPPMREEEMAPYISFMDLVVEEFIEHIPQLPPRRYRITDKARSFVAAVEEGGGWDTVKAVAIARPVRATMYDIARWVLSCSCIVDGDGDKWEDGCWTHGRAMQTGG